MLIIVEGPERAGKTTLAVELVRQYPGYSHLIHNGPPPKIACQHMDGGHRHMLDRYQIQVRLAANRPKDLFVLDRGHISEFAMRSVYRGHSASTDALHRVENQYHRVSDNVMLVMLAPDPDVLVERDDGESEWRPWDRHTDAKRERDVYVELFQRSTLQKVSYTEVREPTAIAALVLQEMSK